MVKLDMDWKWNLSGKWSAQCTQNLFILRHFDAAQKAVQALNEVVVIISVLVPLLSWRMYVKKIEANIKGTHWHISQYYTLEQQKYNWILM